MFLQSLWPWPKRVALVAPASPPEDGAIDECIRRLNMLGIETFPGDNVYAHHFFCAGTIAQRIDDLYKAYERPDIDAVWCLRGGTGAAQLIEHIDWNRLKKAGNRPIIGYSDITTLHVNFQRHGLPSIHGPVAVEVNKLDLDDPLVTESERWKSLSSISAALKDNKGHIALSSKPEFSTDIESLLVGGNLTVLASLCGTAAEIKINDPSFLLLEDVDEPFYALERCFIQLLGNLDFKKITAVVLGEFFQCTTDKDDGMTVKDIIEEWLRPTGIPVISGMPIGHNSKNIAFPYGSVGHIRGNILEWSKQRVPKDSIS